MKILYKPFAIIASVVGAKLGRTVFKSVWSKLDASEPPAPTTGEASLPKVVGAAALEAATMAGVSAAIDRASARTFHYLTGIWPGKKKEKKKNEEDGED
jgi:predicted DNA-binding transcriptional regulator YafY